MPQRRQRGTRRWFPIVIWPLDLVLTLKPELIAQRVVHWIDDTPLPPSSYLPLSATRRRSHPRRRRDDTVPMPLLTPTSLEPNNNMFEGYLPWPCTVGISVIVWTWRSRHPAVAKVRKHGYRECKSFWVIRAERISFAKWLRKCRFVWRYLAYCWAESEFETWSNSLGFSSTVKLRKRVGSSLFVFMVAIKLRTR